MFDESPMITPEKLSGDDNEIDIVTELENIEIIDGFQFKSFSTCEEMMLEEEKQSQNMGSHPRFSKLKMPKTSTPTKRIEVSETETSDHSHRSEFSEKLPKDPLSFNDQPDSVIENDLVTNRSKEMNECAEQKYRNVAKPSLQVCHRDDTERHRFQDERRTKEAKQAYMERIFNAMDDDDESEVSSKNDTLPSENVTLTTKNDTFIPTPSRRFQNLVTEANLYLGEDVSCTNDELEQRWGFINSQGNRYSIRLATKKTKEYCRGLIQSQVPKTVRSGALKLPNIRHLVEWAPHIKGNKMHISGKMVDENGYLIAACLGKFNSSKMLTRNTEFNFRSKNALYVLRGKMHSDSLMPEFVTSAFSNGIPRCWKVLKSNWSRFIRARMTQSGLVKFVLYKRVEDVYSDDTESMVSCWENERLRKIKRE